MNEKCIFTELAIQLCKTLIESGVQPHCAWGDYSVNYKPIVNFAKEHNCNEYSEELLAKYRQSVQEEYEQERFVRKTYLSRLRAIDRLIEFFETGQLSHVCSKGNSKKQLTYCNEKLILEFLSWEEHLTPKTKADADWAVRSYLSWLDKQGCGNALDASAHSFSGFLTNAAEKYSDGGLYDLQLYLKKFHHFLREAKGIDIPFEFVLSLPIIRTKKIFHPITQDEIQRTLAQINRDTAMGKRDYAIILLAARSGMRGCDIVNLKLQDIKWRKNEITFIQKKTQMPIVLPLLPDVGEALKEYILNGRPETAAINVFVRCVHPYLPFGNAVPLAHILLRYQKLAGIERYANDGKGFHSFRRALGKELTLAEIPVTTTAQVLGHSSINSSKQYISLDSEHLKDCALPLDGISPEGEVYRHE